MSIKPILFSGPMVRALLDGRKTQTRRIIKTPKKRPSLFDGNWADDYIMDPGNDEWRARDVKYAPGDLLYVRENWNRACELDENDRPATEMRDYYAADGQPFSTWIDPDTGYARGDGMPWRPSIHMPRSASRLTLEVTDVRIQRLQAISEADAEAEGIERDRETGSWWGAEGSAVTPGATPRFSHSENAFRSIWDSIYEARGDGWSSNQWVAALTFRVHRCNVDKIAP